MWTKELWVKEVLTNECSKANPEILGFIYDITNHNPTPEGVEIIESMFCSGYCYHFALILNNLFEGEIVWHKYFSHILWRETQTQICYDAHGVFRDYDDHDIVPVSVLGERGLEAFLHRGKDKAYPDFEDYVQKRVNEYEKSMGWEVTTNPYSTKNRDNTHEITELFD